MKRLNRAAFAAAVFALAPAGARAADVDPSVRTANLPDSWLVLYNANDAESVAWKDFYIAEWGVPAEHTLGLNVDAAQERIHRDEFRDLIFTPVNDYLNANPAIKARVMGILVGYRVPGNCYLDATHPALPGGGGWSIANNLTDLSSDTNYRRANPHYFVYYASGAQDQLTKATLAADTYITARIDGPTLADAMALTTRAKAIANSTDPLPASDGLLYDYNDPGTPSGDDWYVLKFGVNDPDANTPPQRWPWRAFDSDLDASPDAAMEFSYYRVAAWQNVPYNASSPGSRILGYALNSYGATTVRSTTGHNGRYVPNALVRGGFAAALGSTAEPYLGNEPDVTTIVWSMAEGWTVAEAVFRANPYRNYMWELHGDPLMTVPHWFDAAGNVAPDAPSALGPAALATGASTTDKTPTVEFTLSDPDAADLVGYRVQIDDSSNFASPVVDYTSVQQAQGAASFTVGQAAGVGTYAAGAAGQRLSPGVYYWRAAAFDALGAGPWSAANGGAAAFTVVEPTVDFLTSSYTYSEAAGSPSLMVRLSGSSAETVTVNYATVDGTALAGSDYTATSGTLTFLPGQLSRTFTFTILDDADDESDEVFTIALSAATNATVGGVNSPVAVTLADNDEAPVDDDPPPPDDDDPPPPDDDPPPPPPGGGGGGGGGSPDPAPPADGDGDGTPDSEDGCPDDAGKTAAGVCGCGAADEDSDGDGLLDCEDECPADPNKSEPGLRGCGLPEDEPVDAEPLDPSGVGGGGVVVVPDPAGGGTIDVPPPTEEEPTEPDEEPVPVGGNGSLGGTIIPDPDGNVDGENENPQGPSNAPSAAMCGASGSASLMGLVSAMAGISLARPRRARRAD
jgi:uncharacterized protein (TIGR03790 family)